MTDFANNVDFNQKLMVLVRDNLPAGEVDYETAELVSSLTDFVYFIRQKQTEKVNKDMMETINTLKHSLEVERLSNEELEREIELSLKDHEDCIKNLETEIIDLKKNQFVLIQDNINLETENNLLEAKIKEYENVFNSFSKLSKMVNDLLKEESECETEIPEECTDDFFDELYNDDDAAPIKNAWDDQYYHMFEEDK
jgi:hypothetical protein